MYAIELLELEHENVIRLNRVMRKACLSILDGKKIATEDFRLFITFIRVYADQLHHGKEELFLFKEMRERLGSAAKTLINQGMLVEHDLGRLYVQQLETAVAAYEQNNSSENKLDVLSNAMSYADLLKRHIERENGAVYPFAERSLSSEVLLELDKQTHEFESKNLTVRNSQLDVLTLLEKRYGI